jgi:hypothetical protein
MDLAAAAGAVRRSPWQRERGLPTGLAAKSRCRRYRENLKNRQENPRFWLGKRLRIRGDQRTWQWVAKSVLHIGGPGAVRPGPSGPRI